VRRSASLVGERQCQPRRSAPPSTPRGPALGWPDAVPQRGCGEAAAPKAFDARTRRPKRPLGAPTLHLTSALYPLTLARRCSV